MEVKSAKFVISNTELAKCPAPDRPEFAFIGRSNVGKSSLINMLTGHSKLAKTSSQPGKTQLINHFIINDLWYLVDLPGYGYAKASMSKRKLWRKFIDSYILTRENLCCLFVLVDGRHEPIKNDLDFINFLGEHQVPFVIIMTKADKLKKRELDRNRSAYQSVLSEKWEELPQIFVTSAKTGAGKEGILDFIGEVNRSWK